MAVVPSRNKHREDDDDESPKSGMQAVDLSDASLPKGAKSKLDPESDAFSREAPPKAGRYDLKLFAAKGGYKQGLIDEDGDESDPDNIMYSANLEMRIQKDSDPIADDYPVYGTVITRIPRGKSNSTMGTLVVRLGYELPEESTPLGLIQLLAKIIKKEPVLRGNKLDWRGWSKLQKREVYSKMDDFPEGPDGEPNHIAYVSTKGGGKEEIRARVQVVEWGSAKGVTGVEKEGTAKPRPKAAVPVEEEEEVPRPKAKAKVPVEEEEELPRPKPKLVPKEVEEEEPAPKLKKPKAVEEEEEEPPVRRKKPREEEEL